MKVYLVGAVLDYLGSKVHQIACFEKEVENPKFNHQYYDKMGNSQKAYYLFETQQEADEKYLSMIGRLKEMNGIRNFPEDWKETYIEVFERAEMNYPHIII